MRLTWGNTNFWRALAQARGESARIRGLRMKMDDL
jgi:hypothetical protein